jgi:hypothetical protein
VYPGLPSSLALLLVSHHSLRITVRVLDLAHRAIGDPISNRLLDGQVNVDADGTVTRSATLTFLDPAMILDFDSDSPADGALYADRMLAITYDVMQPGTNGGKWIQVPIFTGPITKFVRDGAKVTVECQGKEVLTQSAPWATYTAKKNRRKVDVIEEVMRREGERSFAMIDSNARMPGDAVMTADYAGGVWAFVQSIARSMGLHLFYDGAGRLRLRANSSTSVFTFRDGTGGSIVDAPTVEFLTDDVKNAVRVLGKQPKGKKTKSGMTKPPRVRAVAVAANSHPLSPYRLGRNGASRYLAEFIDDPKIGTNREAQRVANARLAVLLQMLVTVKFNSLVIPHLDGGDFVTVQTSRFSLRIRLASFSIPLTASGRMSVGINRRATPNRSRIRR